ncbi:DUF2065 domain-containing protein [Pseudoalteromonas sp. MMG024]|uniref:DUF2065 domain-containing protein n=1 Tax=Pseudoalteromonas sp. MMG024 TaxID=2909980 RepID=UPI001F456D54|nr:DUF2065 domain-containing protein [Pseudoalteromonas sp. MMG024]MCF6457602.1 DUF2065 domain-containing protein [Pseudoalteromonas sp. MMG024]
MSFDVLLLAFALFPAKWREYLREIAQLADPQLRMIGVALILIGWLLFMWLKP